MSAGNAAGGYGSAAPARPFLPPEENGRLPDPYAMIGRAKALGDLAFSLESGAAPPLVVRRQIERLRAEDPGNPEAAFWLGRAHERAIEGARGPAEQAEHARAASAAYLEAFALGRRDAPTLVRGIGIDAPGRQAEALDRLRVLSHSIPPHCQVLLLEARLLRDLARDAEAEEACRAADRLCRSRADRRAWGETCR
jgi:hypothetical protein